MGDPLCYNMIRFGISSLSTVHAAKVNLTEDYTVSG